MEGAEGGLGARGHVFHYVTAASQRQQQRRTALRTTRCSGGCCNRGGVGEQTRGRTGGQTREDAAPR